MNNCIYPTENNYKIKFDTSDLGAYIYDHNTHSMCNDCYAVFLAVYPDYNP